MSDYAVVRDEGGEIESCECCGCEVATSLFDKPHHLQTKEAWGRSVGESIGRENQFRYCEVCASTLISSAHGYSGQHLEDGHLLRCLAQCTNMILEAIRAKEQPK